MIGAIGLSLGALAPIVTGAVGLWGYATRGYFIAKTGEMVNGPAGLVTCIFFVLAGLWMMGYAVYKYRRQTRRGGMRAVGE